MDMMRPVSLAVPPIAPSNLVGKRTVNGANSVVSLTWNDNSIIETGYAVQRATSGTGPWTTLGTLPANSVLYSDKIGNTNQVYYYQVVANNLVGYTGVAGFPTTTATSDSGAAFVPVPAPAPPTGLTATVLSTLNIRLSWTDNATYETGFIIQRCAGAGCTNFAPLATIGPYSVIGTVSYVDTTPVWGNIYRYRVAATGVALNSSFTTSGYVVFQSAPNAPSNVAATTNLQSPTIARVVLTWTDNSNNESYFVVNVAKDPAFTVGLLTGTYAANSTKVTITNLTRGTNYYFRVQAVNSAGSSPSAVALPSPITTP
jgi:hypothetical protein